MTWDKFSIYTTLICCFCFNVFVCTAVEAASFCSVHFTGSGVFDSDLLDDNRNDLNPLLQTDGKGVWLSAWLHQMEPANPLSRAMSYIIVKRSVDNGVSWQEAKWISCGTDDCYYYADAPRMATDGKGIWIVSWTDMYSGATSMGDIIFSRSTDNGQTWSNPKRMNTFPAQASVQSSVDAIAFGQNAWIVSGSEFDGGDESIYYYRSTDKGLTWSGPDYIDNSLRSSKSFVKLATDHAGNVLAGWTSSDPFSAFSDNQIMTSSSRNDGQSWTVPKAQGFEQVAGAYIGDLMYSSISRNWVMVWESDKNLDNPTGGGVSENILYSYSSDWGNTWSTTAWLYGSATDSKDDRFPRLYTDSSGNISCAWQRLSGEADGDLIYLSCSTTGGSSWPAPSDLNRYMQSKVLIEEVPAMAMGKDENVLALWSARHAADGAVSDEATLFLSQAVAGGGGNVHVIGGLSILLLDKK